MGLSATPITPVAGTPDFYPPQGGTTVLAADIEALAQATANWVTYLQNRIPVVSQRGDQNLSATYESFTDHTGYTTSTNVYVEVPNSEIGDTILVDFTWNGRFSSTVAGEYGKFKPIITQDHGGTPASLSTNGGITQIHATDPAYTYAIYFPHSITYSFVVTKAGTTRISLGGTVTAAGGTLYVSFSWSARAVHIPAT